MSIVEGEWWFDWDDTKAATNLAKHGISFDEAVTTFADPNAVVYDDPDHSNFEERFLLFGISRSLRLLIVSHWVRESSQTIRLISARRVKPHEEHFYATGRYGNA